MTYTVGFMLATHQHEATEPGFASIVGLAYGLMSGVFANRAWRTWKVIHGPARAHSALASAAAR